MLVFTVIAIISLMVGMVCLIDLWNKKCSVLRRLLWSPVSFIPLFGPLIYYALFEPPTVQRRDMQAPEGPIERWKEWLANRYNPGYFTGGQIHPMYQAVGPAAGIAFLVSGVIGMGFVLLVMGSEGAEDPKGIVLFDTAVSLLMIFAGLSKILEGKKKKNKE